MPKLLKTPFAIDAAEGFRTDIQESTGAAPNSATYQVGFPPVTMQSIASNGMPPKGSDLNGVLYDITDNLVFLTQGGGYGFDSAYATSIGGYPLNARLRLTNGDIVKSTVEGNVNNPNVDMTGWVNPSATIKTLDYFGGSIERASVWVKQSTSNFVELPPSEFTLPTGVQYFNRFVCKTGRAKINIPATTDLNYGSFAADEVLHIDGIDFYIEGHRLGVTSTSSQTVYATDRNNFKCKTVHLKNINIFGMKDGSYIDDIGKTRCCVFINFLVAEQQEIQNIKLFGVRSLCNSASSSPLATHDDFNIICINADTGIYYSPSTWLSGSVKNVKLINTAIQQTYYVGKDAGLANNGKDAVMNSATYMIPPKISGIYAEYAIERSIYIQASNAIVDDIVDSYSYSGAHIKTVPDGEQFGEIKATNISAANTTNQGDTFQIYGLKEYKVSGIKYSNAAKTDGRVFVFTNVGTIDIADLFVKNTSTVFYMADSTSKTNKLVVKKAILDNVYSSVVPYIYFRRGSTATDVLNTLELIDINHFVDLSTVQPSDLYRVALNLTGVQKTIISNSSFVVGQTLYNNVPNYVELNNVDILIYSAATFAQMFTNLKLGGQDGLTANIFDVNFTLRSTSASNVGMYANIHCEHKIDSGVVRCIDYWDNIDLEIPVSVVTSVLTIALGSASYRLSACFGDSIIEAIYNPLTNNFTTISVVGTQLDHTTRDDAKITFVVATASANRLDINIGKTTWSGGVGNLKVKLSRL